MLYCESYHPNFPFKSLADGFCPQSLESGKEEIYFHETELQVPLRMSGEEVGR